MTTCKWCGRTFAGSEQNGLIGGWYKTCSESCRLELTRSIAAGNTAEYRNAFEGSLKLLFKLFLVGLVGSYLATKCGSGSAAQPDEAATTTVERIAAPAAESSEDEPTSPPRQGFGAPGQFDLPPDAAPAVEEGEIRTMPAPEPTEAAPAEVAADSSGAS